MRCLGVRISYNDVGKLIEEFDEDGSGAVELDEFENIISRFVNRRKCYTITNKVHFTGYQAQQYWFTYRENPQEMIGNI